MRIVLVASVLLFATLAGCSGGGLFGDDGITPKDYLTNGTYHTWVIEVDWVRGQKPDQTILDMLHDRMAEVANKDAIQIQLGSEVATGNPVWNDGNLDKLERDTRDVDTGGSTIATHLLFLDGKYHVDGVLGVTYGRGPVYIFSQSVKDQCTLLNGCLDQASNTRTVLQAVVVHEFGHALGLVNNGLTMVKDHEDKEHKGHSPNRSSVMYYAVDTRQVFALLSGGVPTTFDADDRADIRAAGGK